MVTQVLLAPSTLDEAVLPETRPMRSLTRDRRQVRERSSRWVRESEQVAIRLEMCTRSSQRWP